MEFCVKNALFKSIVVLLSLTAFTACPNNDRSNPQATQLQAPPPVPPQAPVTSPAPLDPMIKSFQCDFEAFRDTTKKYWKFSSRIPKTTSLITLYGNTKQNVNLRSKFLGIDIGKFGEIYMQFVPGEKNKSGADTINIVNRGLNKSMSMTQSGFAGQEVKIMAAGNNMDVSISCRGTTQFKGGADNTGKTKLICFGKSSTAVTTEEEIRFERPLNSIIAGEVFEISSAVSAKLDSKAATITFEASLDPGIAPAVISVASLKSPAMLTISDKSIPEANIEVECRLQ